MIQYVIRIQVVELARREGIAEIEQVREIPEQLIVSLDTTKTWFSLGMAVTEAQRIFKLLGR